MNVTQLPDLARMRALSLRVRDLSPEGTLDFLESEDGQWLFIECGAYLDRDVHVKLVKALCRGLPAGAVTRAIAESDGGDHA